MLFYASGLQIFWNYFGLATIILLSFTPVLLKRRLSFENISIFLTEWFPLKKKIGTYVDGVTLKGP